jgi:hypothetical protein
MESVDETVDDYRTAAYQRHAAQVAADLRSLADRVEREARPYKSGGVTGAPRHLNAAEAVNHAITWGIANIGAYRLFELAYHADAAEAEAAR